MNSTNSTPKHTSSDEQLDQAINEMSVLCEFPNDREYCADMAGQVRSFPITQDCRKAIKAYIKTHYIKKADVVEALPEMPDFTRLETNDYTKGMYEGWKVYRQQIRESLNLEGEK